MQTFLPYPNFAHSLASLDNRRLQAQMNESMLVLNTLCKEKAGYTGRLGWQNHPVTRMWRPHRELLMLYFTIACGEYHSRFKRLGYIPAYAILQGVNVVPTEQLPDVNEDVASRSWGAPALHDLTIPWWLGDEKFHAHHRARLVEKNPEHYREVAGFTEEPITGNIYPDPTNVGVWHHYPARRTRSESH